MAKRFLLFGFSLVLTILTCGCVDYSTSGEDKLAKGDLNGAIGDFSKAIESQPSFFLPYHERGTAKEEQGDLDGAIADDSKAIELAGNYPPLYTFRAHAEAAKGDSDAAIADLSNTIEMTQNSGMTQSSPTRSVVTGYGQYATFTLADIAEAHYIRGLVRMKRNHGGDLDSAIEDFTYCIQLFPAQASGYDGRGIAEYLKGDNDAAIADQTMAIHLKPSAESYNSRAVARRAKGDLDGAIADDTQAIELKSDYADAYTNRAADRQAKGDIAGAQADSAKANQLKPGVLPPRPQHTQINSVPSDTIGPPNPVPLVPAGSPATTQSNPARPLISE
jgi:tetratricopeptide (TPR) repeat protein